MTERGPNGRYIKRISRAPDSLPDLAIVVVHLDRKSGDIHIDDEFSTPMETNAMLVWAAEMSKVKLEDRLFDRHETE